MPTEFPCSRIGESPVPQQSAKNLQPGKVIAKVAPIPRQKAVGVERRVRANEEIRDDASGTPST
jgi:hypothetical protein